MAYKSILVYADNSRHLALRVRAAAIVGENSGAHVVGIAVTGISRYLRMSAEAGQRHEQGVNLLTDQLNRLHASAAAALACFEDTARTAGIRHFECRTVADEGMDGLSLHARYADLVILTQPDPDEPAEPMYDDLPEYVAVSSGRPVLVLPLACEDVALPANPVLAWDGSLESTRAVHHALPLLERVGKVKVLILSHGGKRKPAPPHDAAGNDIAHYLAHHGIQAEVIQEHGSRGDIGGALLACCDALRGDLLVMGCYGHSRFHEMLLGGATRSVMEGMAIPVLMAH